MSKNYGIPYMGSKNGIAKNICDYILFRHDKKYFIDACCGGLAISHYILENSNLKILANDLDKDLIDFYNLIGSKELDELIEKYCIHWVDRDTYNKLYPTATGALKVILMCVWTFGNRSYGGTYLFGKDIELQKELLHNLLVFGNEDNLSEYFKAHENERIDILNLIRDWYKNILPEKIKKEPYSQYKRLDFMFEWKQFAREKDIERLERQQQQQQASRLEDLARTVNNERLDRLKQLQELERHTTTTTTTTIAKSDKRIEFYNMDCIDFLNSIPKEILENAIVYLDPPYKNTEGYKESEKNIHDRIVKWAIDHKDICPVYVSEYSILEGLENCFFENKAQTLNSANIEHRTIKKERLLYNKHPEINECLGDLLGLWTEK